jgi:hypothetical protein
MKGIPVCRGKYRSDAGQAEDRRLEIAGDIISDDFAPADVHDVMGKDLRRR